MRCHMLVLLMALLLAAATPSLVSGQEVGEVLLNLTTPRSPATGGLSGKVALPETLIFEEASE